ncbi:MAG: hypothetical protein K8S15_01060 [Candidatus Aegiribacteria sp.]|nr:hypothetical protein [Candidatus Aegiribacteria sp.]
MNKQILIGSLLILVFFITASCGSSSPVDPVISDGTWTGSIIGQPITFTVEGNQVGDIQFAFIYWGISLPADTVHWTPDDAVITNNNFHVVDSLSTGNYSYTMTLEGTFDPPTDISGLFSTTGAFDSTGVHHNESDSLSWSGSHQ